MEPYLGQIILFAGRIQMENWMPCDGRLLPVSEYHPLFSLFGQTYGGDGVSNFGLPDLRSRVPVGAGHAPGMLGYAVGQIGGSETVTLQPSQMPVHVHQAYATATEATTGEPANAMLAATPAADAFYFDPTKASAPAPTPTAMGEKTISFNNGDQAHANIMPFLALQYLVCVTGGIYPQHP